MSNNTALIQAQLEKCQRERLPLTVVDMYTFSTTIGSTKYTIQISPQYPNQAPKLKKDKYDLECPIITCWNASFTLLDIVNHLRINEGYDGYFLQQKCALAQNEIKDAINRSPYNAVQSADGRLRVIKETKTVSAAIDKATQSEQRQHSAETKIASIVDQLFTLMEQVNQLQEKKDSLQKEATKYSKDPQQILVESKRLKTESMKQQISQIDAELASLSSALASKQIKPDQFALEYRQKTHMKLKLQKLLQRI